MECAAVRPGQIFTCLVNWACSSFLVNSQHSCSVQGCLGMCCSDQSGHMLQSSNRLCCAWHVVRKIFLYLSHLPFCRKAKYLAKYFPVNMLQCCFSICWLTPAPERSYLKYLSWSNICLDPLDAAEVTLDYVGISAATACWLDRQLYWLLASPCYLDTVF